MYGLQLLKHMIFYLVGRLWYDLPIKFYFGENMALTIM